MANLTNPEPLSPEVQRAFESLRSSQKLRALTASEDGSGINRLPGGVFGFTYSPVENNFPLFNDRDLRSFETHKLADGRVLLLGFLTRDELKPFEESGSETTIHLFPEPKGEATELVRVPLARIVRHAENSARRGTGLELLLGPER
jgi:hypothetical protein